jgi:ferric-chelate reductase (NADPH)
MASGKGILLGALGGLLLRDATVRAVRDIAGCFRGVELAGPGLRGVTFHPGDKIQVLLPSREVRTFTPMRWDVAAGVTELLVYHHTASPAGQWIRALTVGEACRFVGPQRSIHLPDTGPVVLFGDETSAAVARAFAASGRAIAGVLETGAEDDLRTALGPDGEGATLVPRRADDAHLAQVIDALQAALARLPGARLVLTGRAQAIQGVRAAVKARSLPRPAATKAYWSLGKAGLD